MRGILCTFPQKFPAQKYSRVYLQMNPRDDRNIEQPLEKSDIFRHERVPLLCNDKLKETKKEEDERWLKRCELTKKEKRNNLANTGHVSPRAFPFQSSSKQNQFDARAICTRARVEEIQSGKRPDGPQFPDK